MFSIKFLFLSFAVTLSFSQDIRKRNKHSKCLEALNIENIPFITPKFAIIYVPISNIIERCLE